ncbi:hypothetical protein HDE_00491 [Halotydeus destructor]|nr:hypothetical protein HDE_00491 [Halotydeus destructor]
MERRFRRDPICVDTGCVVIGEARLPPVVAGLNYLAVPAVCYWQVPFMMRLSMLVSTIQQVNESNPPKSQLPKSMLRTGCRIENPNLSETDICIYKQQLWRHYCAVQNESLNYGSLNRRKQGKFSIEKTYVSSKRTKKSARAMITPDVNLKANEVSVPFEIYRRLGGQECGRFALLNRMPSIRPENLTGNIVVRCNGGNTIGIPLGITQGSTHQYKITVQDVGWLIPTPTMQVSSIHALHESLMNHEPICDGFEARCSSSREDFSVVSSSVPALRGFPSLLASMNALHTAVVANNVLALVRILRLPKCSRWSGSLTTGELQYSPIELAFHLELKGNSRRQVIFQLLNETIQLPRPLPLPDLPAVTLKELSLGLLSRWSTTGASILSSSLRDESLKRLVNYGASLSVLDNAGKSLGFQLVDYMVGSQRIKLLAHFGLLLVTFQSDGTSLLEYAARAKSPVDVLVLILQYYASDCVNRCNSSHLTFLHLLVVNYSVAEVKLILDQYPEKFRLANPVYRGFVKFIRNVESEMTVRSRLSVMPLLRSYGYQVDSEELSVLADTFPMIALEVVLDDRLPTDKSLASKILLHCLTQEVGTTRNRLVRFIRSQDVVLANYIEPGKALTFYVQSQTRNTSQMRKFINALQYCGWEFSIDDAVVMVAKNHLSSVLACGDLAVVISENATKLIVVYITKLLADIGVRPGMVQIKRDIAKLSSKSVTNVWLQSVNMSEIQHLTTAHCFEGLQSVTILGCFLACIEMTRFATDWLPDKDVEELLAWFYSQGCVTVCSDIEVALRIRHCPGVIPFLLNNATDPNLKVRAHLLRELRFIDNNCSIIRSLTPYLTFEDDMDYSVASVTLSFMGRELLRYELVMKNIITDTGCDAERLITLSVNFMVAIDLMEAALVLLSLSKAPSKLVVTIPSRYDESSSRILLFYYVHCISYGKWKTSPPPLSLLAAAKLRQTGFDCTKVSLPELTDAALRPAVLERLEMSPTLETEIRSMIEQ